MSALRLIIFSLFYLLPSLNLQAQDETAVQLVESSVAQSLVEIRTINSKTFDEGNGHMVTGTYHTQGSGVVIDSEGLIVTNSHIVANAPQIFVGLADGTVLPATIVYSSDADFSFLKVNPPYPLTPITWSDSSAAQVGTTVITLSSDGSDQEHVLGGAITNLIYGDASNTVEMFELNFNLFHGDSGGPLLDSEGHLLGLIMGKKNSADDKSYAIASNKIKQEYQQFKDNS